MVSSYECRTLYEVLPRITLGQSHRVLLPLSSNTVRAGFTLKKSLQWLLQSSPQKAKQACREGMPSSQRRAQLTCWAFWDSLGSEPALRRTWPSAGICTRRKADKLRATTRNLRRESTEGQGDTTSASLNRRQIATSIHEVSLAWGTK